ncbi:hypothetical protein [Coleofasciculus sp. F4-SAH-05]
MLISILSVICHLSFVIYHLSFVICHLYFVFCYTRFPKSTLIGAGLVISG